MDKLQGYRQPLVTATGILLGFILNYASSWAKDASKKPILNEVIVAISLILCITLLVTVLYRILNIHYPKERAETYYHKTLLMFIIGISIPFAAIMMIVMKSFMFNNI
jgi:hypothetical protein